uniref:C-type lectin domain-containing protein n=1 Tax=Varanus komodoensis TaxID=61221 RepID=A0A8D2J8X3_VARKO
AVIKRTIVSKIADASIHKQEPAAKTIINKCDCRSIQACPPSWIGYKENCYYFSKAERNWTSSQKFCSSHNASLASPKLNGALRFVAGKGSCWIGLTRDSGQPWKWLDGGNSTFAQKMIRHFQEKENYCVHSSGNPTSTCRKEVGILG